MTPSANVGISMTCRRASVAWCIGMAEYRYIARTAAGEEVTGVMQADSETAVARTLDDRSLYPVRVTEAVPRARGLAGGRVRLRDVSVMYGQLSDLLAAGVPMLRALETLIKAVANPRLAEVIRRVRDDVSAGKTLADALARHPGVFPSLHSAMVHAGERAGFLEDVLANLAAFLERQDDLRSRVRGALIYPVMLTLIGTLAVLGMLIFLVPKFQPVFADIPKPLPTMILFALSDLLVAQWPLLFGLIALVVFSVWTLVRSESGRRVWDRWRLKIPVFGKAILMVGITRFCRILGTMLANGVPILQALSISRDAAGSTLLAENIEKATENVRKGEPLASPLKAGGLMPPEIVEMIAVAEESNQLEKVLVQIAETFERRTGRQVDQAVRLIEPLVLVLIAGIIGFVALGLLYPIFTMAQTMK